MLLKLHETARRGGYMDDYIYTIGREFGSDGKNVGIALAKKLNIKCYDKELLAEAAKQSGLCEEIFENHDEKPTNSFLYSLVMDTYSMNGYASAPFLDMPLNHKVFLAQFEAIKKIAAEGHFQFLYRWSRQNRAYVQKTPAVDSSLIFRILQALTATKIF